MRALLLYCLFIGRARARERETVGWPEIETSGNKLKTTKTTTTSGDGFGARSFHWARCAARIWRASHKTNYDNLGQASERLDWATAPLRDAGRELRRACKKTRCQCNWTAPTTFQLINIGAPKQQRRRARNRASGRSIDRFVPALTSTRVRCARLCLCGLPCATPSGRLGFAASSALPLLLRRPKV